MREFNMFKRGLLRCPVCNKYFMDEQTLEPHLIHCLKVASLQFNVDTLDEDMADDVECAICLEPFVKSEEIARLPCLCIYHKVCFLGWIEKRPCCPEHPDLPT